LLEPFAPRVEGGRPCTRSGWWLTSGKYFREGKRMPDFETGNGPPIWQWLEPQPEGKQWVIPETEDGKG
jgi:hypothetical protein